MRKILIIGAAAIGLAGCDPTQITQSQVDAARSGYDAAFLTPMAKYRNLGFCATGTVATVAKPCASRATVAKLIAADNAVSTAVTSLQAQVTAGNTAGASAALTTLQTAVTAAEAIAAANGL